MKKKILAILLTLCMSLALVACGNQNSMEADTISIDGIYANTSVTDKGKTLVYLFYTIKAPKENESLSSITMKMIVNDTNTYENVMKSSYAPIYTNYCYSELVKDVYVGSTYQMCSAFEIPEGDLTGSKKVKLENVSVSGIKKISFTTDDIKMMESAKAIASDLDSTVCEEKYQAEKEKMETASSSRISQVRKAVNGYQWKFYPITGTTSNKTILQFQSPNKFYIKDSFGLSNSGVYKVRKGVILLDYQNDGYRPAIAYTLNSGNIELTDLAEVFSTYVDYDPLGNE